MRTWSGDGGGDGGGGAGGVSGVGGSVRRGVSDGRGFWPGGSLNMWLVRVVSLVSLVSLVRLVRLVGWLVWSGVGWEGLRTGLPDGAPLSANVYRLADSLGAPVVKPPAAGGIILKSCKVVATTRKAPPAYCLFFSPPTGR